MAKDKETKTKKTSIMDMINDLDGSVSENLAEVNTMEEEVRKMAETKMKEEEKKEKADELIRVTKRAVYTNIRLKIEAKYQKDTNNIMADARNESLELLKKLQNGELTPAKYAEELDKMISEKIKDVEKCGKQRRDDMKELNSSYVGGGYYSYSWDNPFNRLNRSIESEKR